MRLIRGNLTFKSEEAASASPLVDLLCYIIIYKNKFCKITYCGAVSGFSAVFCGVTQGQLLIEPCGLVVCILYLLFDTHIVGILVVFFVGIYMLEVEAVQPLRPNRQAERRLVPINRAQLRYVAVIK